MSRGYSRGYPRAIPRAPSRRAVQAWESFASGDLSLMPEPAKPRQRKPRAMREAGAADAIKEWRLMRADVRLWRNNVGAYPLPGGGFLRYGLCNGSADFVGLRSVVVTPAMVGKRVAVFLALETKAPGKDADTHQDAWLTEVRDAGAIAGVARNAQEAEDLLARWLDLVQQDER
jgi:hypothetical protein